jgi:hypothetical protein
MMVFSQIRNKVPAPRISATLQEDLNLSVSSDSSGENTDDDSANVESLVEKENGIQGGLMTSILV